MRTLAYALVFWAEMSIGAPLLERLRSFRDRQWGVCAFGALEDWGGMENVSDDAAVGEAISHAEGGCYAEAVVVIDKMILKVWGPDVSMVAPLYCIVASLILIRYEGVNRHLDRYQFPPDKPNNNCLRLEA